jgi:hypothetical protein
MIPWSSLESTTKQANSGKIQPKHKNSFVQALTNVCDIPLSQLPQAYVKGDRLAIMILEVEYLFGMDACKRNFHGRIIWSKGATLLTVVSLKNKLTPLWKDLAKQGVISLGRGLDRLNCGI